MRFVKLICLLQLLAGGAHAEPIYDQGTIFIESRILSQVDPTSLTGLTYAGIGMRQMYDRRAGWVDLEAHLFEARYSDGSQAEVQVNPELGDRHAAEAQALFYATEIGRLPSVLRDGMETVWIHAGTEPFGGGNNNFLIHVGQGALYAEKGILLETLVHEGVHTSLDEAWANSPGWLAAQAADGKFISQYAHDNPAREDLAETFLIWMASRYFPDRIDADVVALAEQGNAARFAFFDGLDLDMSPYRLAD